MRDLAVPLPYPAAVRSEATGLKRGHAPTVAGGWEGGRANLKKILKHAIHPMVVAIVVHVLDWVPRLLGRFLLRDTLHHLPTLNDLALLSVKNC
jgi:hypothetical protein